MMSIGAPSLWTFSPNGPLTGRGVTLAVIDSGWDRADDDNRVRRGVGFVDPADDLKMAFTTDDHDRIGHGSQCARLILDVAPGASIVPVRVFGARLTTSPSTIVAALRWVATARIPLVNLSLGTHRRDVLALLYRACAEARDAGVIIVAAGWHGSIPAAFDSVIGVGVGTSRSPFDYAYRADDQIEILSTGWLPARDGGPARRLVGASFAAPNITGLVALLLEKSPGLDVDAVRLALREHAREQAT